MIGDMSLPSALIMWLIIVLVGVVFSTSVTLFIYGVRGYHLFSYPFVLLVYSVPFCIAYSVRSAYHRCSKTMPIIWPLVFIWEIIKQIIKEILRLPFFLLIFARCVTGECVIPASNAHEAEERPRIWQRRKSRVLSAIYATLTFR